MDVKSIKKFIINSLKKSLPTIFVSLITIYPIFIILMYLNFNLLYISLSKHPFVYHLFFFDQLSFPLLSSCAKPY